jgi:hypothetical protein
LRLEVTQEQHPEVWLNGSRTLLSRMVENVIDNAIVHNEPGGWLRITVEARGGQAGFVVENGGPLLQRAQVEQLAEPFRRIGAERTGSDNGVGLGLSIVAAVAAAHHGTLHLQARDSGGLRVAVALPVATQPAEAGVPA